MWTAVSQIIVEGDGLRVRRMANDSTDVALMAGWLRDPRVLEFYEGRDRPFDERLVREKYAPRAEGGPVVPCIIEETADRAADHAQDPGDDRRTSAKRWSPVGYIQFYPVAENEAPYYGLTDSAEVWGLDLFLGFPERWGKGLGTQTLRLVLGYLFQQRGARRVVVDPVATNARAIRSYEKAGFRRVKLLPQHERHEGRMRDCWLMEAKKGPRCHEAPGPTGFGAEIAERDGA